jgi:excinuclease ABC subunit A
MLKSSAKPAVRLRGVRHNNLKNFDLDLPLNRLIVITGLSGSGKSSLAFDTLFAEGQRRYIETFSPYARQFFDRMDKPQVDSIEGIPPAIAIEQRNSVKTTRSTVGTMTELCDYMKMLWPHVARLHCRQCGEPVKKESPSQIWDMLLRDSSVAKSEVLVTFELPLTDKLSLEESLALVSKQGYQRLLFRNEVLRLEEAASKFAEEKIRLASLCIIQDRISISPANRARFVEACEQAYHFGKGKLTIRPLAKAAAALPFSNRLHCASCDLDYREPSPALFSFNNPVGACPACRGFGRTISIDYELALPDKYKTLAQGVVKPWQTGQGADCQRDLLRMCRHFDVPTDVPFEELPEKWQRFVIDGEPDYGKDEEHEWPRAWYGVKGYFRWLESKSYKMHVRVLLSRYRAYTPCPDCRGKRFQPEALLYKMNWPVKHGSETSSGAGMTLADFYQLPIRDALRFVEALVADKSLEVSKRASGQRVLSDPLALALGEVRSRLGYLDAVGLGYLTLDRPTRSLSGGETERVNLTTCLGTRLVNTLFVLDEPSVGLHPRDTDRLVKILQQLRDAGNTVVVVEHEASVMRAADVIVDLGPGHGVEGGQVVFQGPYKRILRAKGSLTGDYLSGREQIDTPVRRGSPLRRATESWQPEAMDPNLLMLNDRAVPYRTESSTARPHALQAARPRFSAPDDQPMLKLRNITRHNLKKLNVDIPLGKFVCITGVSGSGKTTLVRDALLPALARRLKSEIPGAKAADRMPADKNGDEEESEANDIEVGASRLEGVELLGQAIMVDQSILGKTPRSNPAVYIGAFEDIRELFAQSEQAKERGLNASAFSFNSAQGQCERCRGAGFEKIEMQFLSDIFIRCPDCQGRRYQEHILQIKLEGSGKSLSIAGLLDATVDEAIDFLQAFPVARPARRAREALKLLADVGLGYLKLGQPINTLSGGESQRLKLVQHLAETVQAGGALAEQPRENGEPRNGAEPKPKPTLFLFDEPTTGLHIDDVRVLLKVFQRIVDAGHSVAVIEHNLDVIKSADWIIDLGPGAGDEGGNLVAAGTPEDVARCTTSYTGQALAAVLGPPAQRFKVPAVLRARG